MEVLMDSLVQFAVEIIVVIIGALLSVVLHEVKQWIGTLKKKDQTQIVDMITDSVVDYVEVELKGEKGKAKRDFAVEKAIEILAEKGIIVSEDEVIAGIERGVSRLNEHKK